MTPPNIKLIEDLEGSLQRLLRMVHPRGHDVPKSLLRELKKLAKNKQFDIALWKLTNRLDDSEFKRDEELVKQLLQTWELAISFQHYHLKVKVDEDAISQEERKRVLVSCQEGKRRTLRILKETQLVDKLHEGTFELLFKMHELPIRRYHEIKCDAQDAYYVDALRKITKSDQVLKTENLLKMLKEVWEYLYQYEKYRVERIEEICRALYFGGKYNDNAQMILNQKRQDVANCEEGLQQVNVHLEALLEAKGRPWWQLFMK